MDNRNPMTLDLFTLAYIAAALFTSTTDDDTPMDDLYTMTDLSPESLTSMARDCERFQAENHATLDCEGGQTRECAGHDFWLTRNGHGAGFWDGDWPDAEGEALTKAAEAFGVSDLYVGDDGKLWVSPLVGEAVGT